MFTMIYGVLQQESCFFEVSHVISMSSKIFRCRKASGSHTGLHLALRRNFVSNDWQVGILKGLHSQYEEKIYIYAPEAVPCGHGLDLSVRMVQAASSF